MLQVTAIPGMKPRCTCPMYALSQEKECMHTKYVEKYGGGLSTDFPPTGSTTAVIPNGLFVANADDLAYYCVNETFVQCVKHKKSGGSKPYTLKCCKYSHSGHASCFHIKKVEEFIESTFVHTCCANDVHLK